MALPPWWNDVKRAMAAQRVDVKYWLPILLAESGGNPRAHNRGTRQNPEDSVGLFQLNRRGGQGAGYTVEQLMNPALNAEIAARYIRDGMNRCGRTADGTIQCVAVNSGHPGPVPRDDRRIVWIAQLAEAINPSETDAEAWARGYARHHQGPSGGNPGPVDPGDPDPGGDWLPGIPSGEDIAEGAIGAIGDAVKRMLRVEEGIDVAWSLGFAAAGFFMVGAGLLGLALKSGAVEKAANVTAVVAPAPQVKVGAATVSRGARTIGSVIP